MAGLQNKLSELEKSQLELVAENASLKDLCLYLNEQREQSILAAMAGASISRDSGDGSSGSSLSIDKLVPAIHESDVYLSLDDSQLKSQQITKGFMFAFSYSKITACCGVSVRLVRKSQGGRLKC